MIILDFNQVCISNLMVQIGNHTNMELNEGMLRHMILNTIRSLKTKFGEEYGELIIACDSKNCWRREFFPYYKASRRKSREESELDWKALFESMHKIRTEIKAFFPYPVIEVEGAEADDIIATLVVENTDVVSSSDTKILILSGDKDFIQLHSYSGVKQYDPTRKKWISHENPDYFLMEHVLRGDSSDGVPNVLSPDDTFVTSQRQKPLTQKKIDELISVRIDQKFDHPLFRNYQRNKTLIDLKKVPVIVHRKIMDEYDSQKSKGRDQIFNYFVKNKLKNLMDSIGDF